MCPLIDIYIQTYITNMHHCIYEPSEASVDCDKSSAIERAAISFCLNAETPPMALLDWSIDPFI